MSENLKKTVLNQAHYDLNAKMVDFGGWDMPVQYSGILEEHFAVREKAGLFDVSHMGEIWVTGKDSEKFINYLVSSNISNLDNGQIKYGVLMMETGKAVDDLLVYKFQEEKYLLVVNASNVDKDFTHITNEQKGFDVQVSNESPNVGEIALQGPLSVEILQPLTETALEDIGYYHFAVGQVCGIDAIISRTGYTGEDGFEIYIEDKVGHKIRKVWDAILENKNVIPCGLGCRDTLRFECKMPLYGHELSDSISPLETGIGKFVELDKDNFIGKAALQKEKEAGRTRKIVGIEMVGRGIARDGYKVLQNDVEIGYITSGSYSPSLDKNLGLALVPVSVAIEDTVFVQIRNKVVEAKVVKTPFYKKSK